MDTLRAVFNHLVLPPQLPGVQDPDIKAVSQDVVARMIRACNTAARLADSPWSDAFQSIRASLEACLAVVHSGYLEKSTLCKHFRELKPNHVLILHVIEQNAAVLIRREDSYHGQRVIFEAFETSPPSEQILATGHAVQWDFPGRSAQLPLTTFDDEPFQESLATFLEQASMESLYNLQATVRKANVSVTEIRDTTDPALVTQMLMPLLEAMGSYFHAPILRKRVRDEVNLQDGSLPWRRLPFWLVLRVAAQRQSCLILGSEHGRMAYKCLICILLAELLQETAGKLNPELVVTLRSKLCRRMAKLETEQAAVDDSASLFDHLRPLIQRSIKEATEQVERAWDSFKHATTRQISLLPSHAPSHALQLSLYNSGMRIDSLLNSRPERLGGSTSFNLPQLPDKALEQMQVFTNRMFRLAATELQIARSRKSNGNNSSSDDEARCIRLAKQIDEVFTETGATYDSDPEQRSAMILALFTLWVRLDKCAIVACPLLANYRPVFSPELLDVLQLSTFSDICRLRDIQGYLAQRRSGCRYGTIFEINETCLAVHYTITSDDIQLLGKRIQNASDSARTATEAQWRKDCEEYDMHTKIIQENTCGCVWRDGKLEGGRCVKCYHRRLRKHMKISPHEEFLPANNPARDALLFELVTPKYLTAYRNATWRIFTLAYPTRPTASSIPAIELMDCEPLKHYITAEGQSITLASTTKCFSQTHYKFQSGKVPLSKLTLPLGANFDLYDRASNCWVKDFKEPLTFEHLCGICIPDGLRATILPAVQHPPPIIDGPTSYKVQANQTKCPSDMSLHEFSAFQKLLSGQACRWPNIITEMGSSNLNLSNEDTVRVLCQLVIQAGSSLKDEVLGAAHVIFKEQKFVERLADIIERRLQAIWRNWREHYSMELLITLILRLFSLSSDASRDRATTLLRTARYTTLSWTTSLKSELRAATDADAAQRIALYGFYAALLCRRTFANYAETEQPISADDLSSWIQASVALQENLMVDIDQLPQNIKSMLLRDIKTAYHLQPLLETAIRDHPESVDDGIARAWSEVSDSSTTSFTAWTFLSRPHIRWIVAHASENQDTPSAFQMIHFNIIEGHLLINGKPRGKLPSEIRDSQEVKDMFGNQHLLTYPSPLPGMTHRLSSLVHGQEVHFGMRGGQIVIRAWNREHRQLLEFIPKDIFTSLDSFDLPAELVDNCMHWLNLSTGRLEIRRAPAIWVKRPSDWEIDISTRIASRKNSRLVDPRSDIFAQIANIFRYFEQPEKLTVFQPLSENGKLSVELRHLELSFFVNGNGLLECRQLNMEIDPDQDAGTWHGLLSKIMLRDMITKERSIIVPLGQTEPTYSRYGIHVTVHVGGADEYAKYGIDSVLNRLTCPLEPRLLYTKALYHAITSFCLPDLLTGRTGTEEAFSILLSGAAQPWTPLGGAAHTILNMLESLPPQREYYPRGMKRFQKIIWNKHLTATIQHDGFTSVVRDIVIKSNQLSVFAEGATKPFMLDELTQLHYRGETHRRLYERPIAQIASSAPVDVVYIPRDRNALPRGTNVYEIVRLIVTGCRTLQLETTLESFLEANKVIDGFNSNISSLISREPLINQIEGPINERWGSLIQLCRHADHTGPLLFRLGLLAFCPEPKMDLIRSFVAFATDDRLKALEPPPHSSFVDFLLRERPSVDALQALIVPAYNPFVPTYRWSKRDRFGRNAQEHVDMCEEEGLKFALHVLEQWPVSADELSTETFEAGFINIPRAIEEIRPEWERIRKNCDLERWIDQAQIFLHSIDGTRDTTKMCNWADAGQVYIGLKPLKFFTPTARELLLRSCPRLDNSTLNIPLEAESAATHDGSLSSPTRQLADEAEELEIILMKFSSSATVIRQQYVGDLLQSVAALQRMDYSTEHDEVPTLKGINHAVDQAYHTAMNNLKTITTALASGDNRFQWLHLGSLWPCTSPLEVLSFLRSASAHRYGPGMKEALVQYGLAITHLQRLKRIQHALLRTDGRALYEELQNLGHVNWSPLQSPDWLLLEIDNNILIRSEQVDVAQAMIAPPSGQNSVLQMNMGKGKTSCIVPMVVTALAGGQRLARLIVPKALLMQTAQMMQSRLGGLVGRKVLHIPFSRKTRSEASTLNLYESMHQQACSGRGLILTSHEHVLSYKLGGWQHLADGKLEVAKRMTNFQRWLDSNSRDILDECDFTLAVKTQLNYPSGPEMAVDGNAYRWTVAEELLALVAYHVPTLRESFPSGIEVLERSGSFPIIHILSSDVEDAVHDHILENICAGRTTFLRPVDASFPSRKHVIRSVLSERDFDEQKFSQAASAFVNPQTASKMLLIARGVLMNRILLLCLSKRWNVQYGLHPDRHPVAVPFEAKGKPSERSEFGHPDVAILFTCLAFYYTGLTKKQFLEGLQNILQSDDPAAYYEQWISASHSLPEALHHWNMVNIDDEGQMEELWQCLRSNRIVINHYLNQFVFPIHAKQFEIKLQASAWDLPLCSQDGLRRVGTTGFSGTNDNRAMLPLTIQQDDLPSLKQTSAEVLSYLLQPRNRGYQVTTDPIGKRLTEIGLLDLLHNLGVRVLIDAGAYILEMDNATLAQAWLKIEHEASAAIYFGGDNRAWVHYRGEKRDVPLLATPFADDLSNCVVYLDEAHTRGVDLKLPQDARGALTLALKQTKDFTMQAAMRLRQLRTTQSVTFLAPPEVDQSIKDFCHPNPHEQLDSSHVIAWLLEQTCSVNEELQSLYVAQGLDFCRRTDAVWSHGPLIADATHRTKLLDVLQQPERQTLEQMYGGASAGSGTGPVDRLSSPQLQAFADHLNQRGHGKHGSLQAGALEEVEQEREVQNQVEQVRLVQKPVHYNALTFPGLHRAIEDFVREGRLKYTPSVHRRDIGFIQAFAYVAKTSIGMRFGVRATGTKLYVSAEFTRTIAVPSKQRSAKLDNFLRPVEWILWSPKSQEALVVIPEEAELLIKLLRKDESPVPPVHLIRYAAPVTKAMLSFNNFDYYCLPPLPPYHEFPAWFRFELGVLSGRLYISPEEWDPLVEYLKSPSKGWANKTAPPTTIADHPFAFLLEWLTLLRKTQDVLQTPMGYICTGRKPGENHPFLSLS